MATILIVDDRAANREFLVSLLGYRGHRVLEAGDGVEALALLQSTPAELVISDILMPTMDGFELVRQMRLAAATRNVPVIFFTAHYNERESRNLAEACGVAWVLTKPSAPEPILQAVDQVLNGTPPPPEMPAQFDEAHLRLVNAKLVELTEVLRQASSQSAALIEINLQLASEHDPDKVLSGFCSGVRNLVAARQVVVAVHAADDRPLRKVLTSGMDEITSVGVRRALLRDGAFAELVAAPTSARRRFDEGSSTETGLPAEHPPVRSMVVAPIRSLAHVYGWVCATGKLGFDEFTADDERLLAVFASQVGRIYENGSLYIEMKQQADELRRETEERKLAQAALLQSMENFRYLFLRSPLPMWVFDVSNLKIMEVNEAAIAHYGYSRDEFVSMTLKEMRPPEDVEHLVGWLAEQRSEGVASGRFRHRRKDGQILDVDIYSRGISFNGVQARLALGLDVTAHARTERESRRIFETSQDLLLVTDGFGRFVQVSPSSARVLGYRPDEMVGHGGQEFIFPADLDPTREEMRAARQGNATRNFRSRYVHKDGHIVSLVWTAVWSEQDRRHFFIGRDMTEYDGTEQQLRQAQKMEAVGQLTGGVAHDFNNILTVIMANIDVLGEREGLDSESLNRLDRIAGATQRAADLTRQLLAFSRKQALRPEPVDVNDLVAATGNLLRRSLGEQIEFESLLADDLWTTEVDRAQLESALVNLSINARDAMPDGGRLLIETANRTLDEDYVARHVDVVAGDYAMVAVSDTGKGMPPDVLARVFEPFFTTKEVGKGTGLGLSMVYGFVKQSRGHIKIYSEVGRGTSIRLYLPRGADARPVGAPRQEPAMAQGSERVLVVEDDEQVRAGVVGQLRSLGYEVAEASGGTAGIAAFAAAPERFDLLLTDVIMPGAMNGKALADEVAHRWPRTKILFMSGYTENAIVHHGRLDPGVLLLSKPFRKSDLARLVRQALDGPAEAAATAS